MLADGSAFTDSANADGAGHTYIFSYVGTYTVTFDQLEKF
jgi:alkaline phosphatase